MIGLQYIALMVLVTHDPPLPPALSPVDTAAPTAVDTPSDAPIAITASTLAAATRPAAPRQSSEYRYAPLRFEASFIVSKPLGLGLGLVRGASAVLRYPMRWGFSAILARVDWGFVGEANQDWQIQQHEIRTAAGMQWQMPLQRGRVWTRAVLGGLLIYEHRKRQQAARLKDVPDVQTRASGVSFGPYGHWELGAGVQVWRGFWLGLHVGPAGSVQVINGVMRMRWGWQGGLGVEHAL